MEIFNTLLVQPLANGLIVFYNLLGSNLGLAIIGFTIFLRVILNPLTKPYMKSMKKMRDFGPQLAKLKSKHKNDKVKQAQAQADFYKEKGINPGAGCIPYIIQIVILIAFFRVFTATLNVDDPTAGFNELLYEPLKFSEGEILNTQFLGFDLTQPAVINVDFLPFALPGIILILAALVQFVSAKIMQPYVEVGEKIAKGTKEKEDDMQVALQKSMIFTFPLFTIFFGMRFPAGLALYWLTISLFQTIQQYKTTGWGGMTPFIKRAGLLKSVAQKNYK